MNDDKLREARAPVYTNDVLARGHQYKHIVASRLKLAIGDDDIRDLMVERAAACWKQLRLSRISYGTAFHAPLDEFGAIYPARQFRTPFAFAISLCVPCTTSMERSKIMLTALVARHPLPLLQSSANGNGSLCHRRFGC